MTAQIRDEAAAVAPATTSENTQTLIKTKEFTTMVLSSMTPRKGQAAQAVLVVVEALALGDPDARDYARFGQRLEDLTGWHVDLGHLATAVEERQQLDQLRAGRLDPADLGHEDADPEWMDDWLADDIATYVGLSLRHPLTEAVAA